MYINPDACAGVQKDEFLRLIINSIRNDLISRNESFQCLALGFVGNGGTHIINAPAIWDHSHDCCCSLTNFRVH